MNVRKWSYVVLCAAAWTFLYGLFLHLESSVEPSMFKNGQEAHWWIVVLLYWVSDTAIVLFFARLVARPFGFRMPERFPFFQFGGDVAVSCSSCMSLGYAPTDIFLPN